MMASVVVLVFIFCLLGPLSALPQSSPTDAAGTSEAIGVIDSDGNGRVSLVEFKEFAGTTGIASQEIRADFKDLDSNGDGELDTQEISGLLSPSSSKPATVSAEATPAAKAEPAFLEQVGPVPAARAEPATPANRADFKDLDSNGDGELDTQEMSGLLSPSSSNTATVSAKATPAAKAEPAFEAQAESVPGARAEPAMATKAGPATTAKAEPALPTKADGTLSAIQDQVPGLGALKLDVRRQAAVIIAKGLAERAQMSIQQGEKDKKEAEFIEAKGFALRGSARAAAKTMDAEAWSASKAAVNAAARQGLVEADRLRLESEEFEREAHEHHEHAKQALQQASRAQYA